MTDFDRFAVCYPEFMRDLQLLRHYRQHELAKLRALPARDRHARVRKLLRDRRLHVFYAYEANRRLRQLSTATPDNIRALADNFSAFELCNEPIRIFFAPGRSNERRVVGFGPRRRMQQALVADIIRAIHPPRECQKLFNGGMPAALDAVEAAINEGYDYGVEVDIVHFYASVRLNGLAELLRPLPEATVRNVVWDLGVRRQPDSDLFSTMSPDDPSLSGLVGLAPGAATSPIVGEQIVGQMLVACRDVRLVAYADNVFVLGRQRQDVVVCLEHLQKTAETLEAGRLRLRIDHVRHLRGVSPVAHVPEQFYFLHQVGEYVPSVEITAGAARVSWSPDQRKLEQYRLSERNNAAEVTEIDVIEHKVSQWRRAYPRWRDGDEWEMRYLAELTALRFYQVAEPLNKSRAAHSAILYYYAMDCDILLADFLPDGRNAGERRRREELLIAIEGRLQTIRTRRSLPVIDVEYSSEIII